MPKFSVDLDNVHSTLSKRSYKLADVAHKLEKVGFDVCRFQDAAPDELWQVQDGVDGQYIVALYDTDEEKVVTASPSWSVIVKNAEVHVFYRQEHLFKIAAGDLGVDASELGLVKRYLPAKLASSKTLVASLLKSVGSAASSNILAKYPELA